MFKRPHRITHTVLMIISIIFAILAGISLIAWLLPSLFNSIGNFLVNITQSPDIRLNINRINKDGTTYTIVCTLAALFMRWLAEKF